MDTLDGSIQTNWMDTRGQRLVDGGFRVLPIWPSDKMPALYNPQIGWHNFPLWSVHCDRANRQLEVERWRRWPGCGIGIACGNVVGIDIDIRDAEIAEAVADSARRFLGESPTYRVGLAPKRLIPYRCDEAFAKFTTGPIEILGRGSQFVAYGIHPDTSRPYWWSEELCDLDRDQLPLLDEAKVRAWLEGALKLVPPELRARLKPKRTATNPEEARGLRGTWEAAEAACAHIPNDDLHYDDWVRTGLAIKGAVGEDGYELFDRWSQLSSKYNAKSTRKTWQSLHPHSIGVGTLIMEAQAHGWEADSRITFDAERAEEEADRAAQGEEHHLARLIANLAKRRPVVIDEATGEVLEDEPEPAPASAELLVISSPVSGEELPGDRLVATAGGLLSELVDWMCCTARFPQPLLSLGAALATVGALMGHKYRLATPDTRSNLMIVGLAGSGSGKDHPRQCVQMLLEHADLREFNYGREVASAQGLITALTKNFTGVLQLDEAGHFFGAINDARAPAHLRQINKLLMELYSSSKLVFHDAVRAGDRQKEAIDWGVPAPCFNLFATSTPEPFWEGMKSGQAVDGFLARFLLLKTPLTYPDANLGQEPMEHRLEYLAGRAQQIVTRGVKPTKMAVAAGKGAVQADWIINDKGEQVRSYRLPQIEPTPMTKEAEDLERDYVREEVAMKRASEGKDNATSILARTVEHVRKLALVRAVSRDPVTPEVTAEDMRWAKALVSLSQGQMLPAIVDNIADTPWERSLNKMVSKLKERGDWVDGGTTARVCQFVRGREFKEAIQQLIDAGRVERKIEKSSTKPRTFYRAI